MFSRIHGYRAKYETYRDYRLLVYGSPDQVPGNRFDRLTGQYAKLGFSYDEYEVTNSLFPDDAPGGVTQTTPWQWSELNLGQAARISWARLSSSEKNFIKSARLTYRNNTYGGMTFSSLKLTEDSTIVLAPPSWHLGFALYTVHYLPGSKTKKRYATFNGAGSGAVSVRCDLQMRTLPAADGKFVISNTADAIDIIYDVSGSIEAFQGLARESDILHRGAGNDLGWVAGNGNGPWIKTMVLRVSRSDLAGKAEKQYLLKGAAWVVSRLGDIQLTKTEKVITVRAEEKLPPFQVSVGISGSIRYFSGQTNSLGQTMPLNPRRFLALERIKISLDFTRAIQLTEIDFAGRKIRMSGVPGQKHYEASMIIPLMPSTLAWNGSRLAPALLLQVYALDRSNPAASLFYKTKDIDITGSVYDIAFAQISP
ncbi:MAG TPA: hypothetical protein DD640_03635 [Clostridiales bacterium]|nr:hypothetical protein [Clostridiales bacterium]